jgi:hypothetical protein
MGSKFKKIDVRSADITHSGFTLFNLPPTKSGVESSAIREYHPVATITNEGPYMFRLNSSTEYVDLRSIEVLMELRLEALTGANWAPATPADGICAFNNAIGGTFVRTAQSGMNAVEYYNSNDHYHYRYFFENALGFSNAKRGEQLEIAGWTNPETPTAADEAAFVKRRNDVQNGNWVQYLAPLHFDLAHQPRFMLNGVELTFTLYRNSDAFCLQRFQNPVPVGGGGRPAVKEFRIAVGMMKLRAKMIDAYNAVNISVATALMREPALYPYPRVEMKSIFLSEGRMETPENNLFTDMKPKLLFIAFVPGAAFNGNIERDPFWFDNFNIASISVTANGVSYPATPYDLHFGLDDTRPPRIAPAFQDFNRALGMVGFDRTNGITRSLWRHGRCIFGFIMTPDMENSNLYDMVEQATTSIQVKFRDAVPAGGLQMLLYAVFPGLMTVDINRILTVDGR